MIAEITQLNSYDAMTRLQIFESDDSTLNCQ